MKCFRSMMVGILVLSLLILGTPGININAQYGSPHSISLGPSQATAGPGEIVSYTVYVRSSDPSFRGSVLVDIPGGLSVVGQPSCATGCGQPVVSTGGGRAQIETSISIYGEETATFSFQLMVEASARAGTTFNLTAYLLGGVNTAGGSETAFATLTVASASSSSGSLDNRAAWVDVTPRLLRVAPGGSALYLIQPIFWGEWYGNLPYYTVDIRLPSGISLPAEPLCGPRQLTIAEVNTCDFDVEERSGGSTRILARPGLLDGTSNIVYLTVLFDPALPLDTELQINVYLRVTGDVPAAAQDQQSVNALIVESSELTASGESGVVSGRLEMTTRFSRQGDTCIRDSAYGEQELVLYEWGVADVVLARADVSTGHMGTASNGTGADACILYFRFEGVPESSAYMVALVAAGETFACRACVLGLVTPSEEAEQVFLLE